MMASTISVKMLEVCQIAPPPDSPDSSTEFSLPYTFIDSFWFKFDPVEYIFFYAVLNLDSCFFHSFILQRLKQTLSLTLLHFLPLAGKLEWPQNETKPIIHYTPNDAVSLTIAESGADLNHLCGNKPQSAIESRYYIPELSTSDSEASVIALQVTLFPCQGFCIGLSTHHGVLDGRSAVMFMKAWAHMCKNYEEGKFPSLPSELVPFYGRTFIIDPGELETEQLNVWSSLNPDNPKSLKLAPAPTPHPSSMRATFVLTRQHIKLLREMVANQLDKIVPEANSLHLSTFVLTFAYTLVCCIKAKLADDPNADLIFGFSADIRSRLDPPVPANYFGNCINAYDGVVHKADALLEGFGFAYVAVKVSESVKGLEKGLFIGAKGKLGRYMSRKPEVAREVIAVAGSPKFEAYATDFGWGRPKKMEITSIDRNSSISLAESGDGSGGVEVGIVLKEHQMEMFESLFNDGLPQLAAS